MLSAGLMLVLLTAGQASPAQTASAEAEARLKADEQLLRQHQVSCDGPGLLEFMRQRTLSREQVDRLSAKIKLLGSPSYKIRKKAHDELVQAGEPAKAVLTDALQGSDPEVVRRLELCLRHLEGGQDAPLTAAAARLIAHHKPPGAAEVVLAYFPFATEPAVIEELQRALIAVAKTDGKAEPAVVAALEDKRPSKRAAAAEALVRNGFFDDAKSLLKDAEPTVRLQVGRAFVESKQKHAVPLVIDVLADLPTVRACEAEELLLRLAGDQAPNVYLDGKTPATKVRDAWKTWWHANADKIDLARLDNPPLLGYTLVTQMDLRGLNGRVVELRPDGKEVHWEISGLRYPLDAQVVGKNRVLICEYLNKRVTERDFEGNVLWEHHVDMPISCQRLPNGQTFIVTRRQLLVVDREHKEILSHFHQSPSIAAAQRLPGGQFLLVTSGGQCQRLDAKGQVLKSFQVGSIYTMGGNIEVLPGNRILIPAWRDNRIVEYDLEGKELWSAAMLQPISATRLSNGNTLVVSMAQQRVVELNPQGQQVWEYRTDGRPWRARRR